MLQKYCNFAVVGISESIREIPAYLAGSYP